MLIWWITVDLCVSACSVMSDSMECSPPGSSVPGIFQPRILEWVAISFLQWIFLTQGLNPSGLQAGSLLMSHQGRYCGLRTCYAFTDKLVMASECWKEVEHQFTVVSSSGNPFSFYVLVVGWVGVADPDGCSDKVCPPFSLANRNFVCLVAMCSASGNKSWLDPDN